MVFKASQHLLKMEYHYHMMTFATKQVGDIVAGYSWGQLQIKWRVQMKYLVLAITLLAASPGLVAGADAAGKQPAKPAQSKVDPEIASQHTKEDVRRHRIIAAAHEEAARCQESGKPEDQCMADLAKACKGIAYGKYCGMKHPE